jgi:hypothetical protein
MARTTSFADSASSPLPDDDDALFAAAGTEVDKYQIPPPPRDD